MCCADVETLDLEGFDALLEQFLRAAGPQGPLPASDVVIEGLPRFELTQEVLGQLAQRLCRSS